MHQEPIDSHSSTNAYYEERAAEYFDRTVAADLTHLYTRFLAAVPRGGRILDVGCGSGRDLRVFKERGYSVFGLDASRTLVDMANVYSGAPCVVGRIEDIDYREAFDGIWACASLLHIPKGSIGSVLRRLYAALTAGGVLFVSVQKGDGERTIPDGRYYALYNAAELECALKDAGFAVESIWESEDAISDREGLLWLNMLARK